MYITQYFSKILRKAPKDPYFGTVQLKYWIKVKLANFNFAAKDTIGNKNSIFEI